MDVVDAIKARRTVRSYSERPVADELIEGLLEAARLAPSALNFQPWRFVVVTDRAKIDGIVAASYGQTWIAQAPVVIVCCADTMPGQRMERYRQMVASGRFPQSLVDEFARHAREKGLTRQAATMKDTVIAMEHMALRAVELGLSSGIVGIFNDDIIKELLAIPREMIIVNILMVGYATEVPPPRPRFEMSAIAFRNEFGRPWTAAG